MKRYQHALDKDSKDSNLGYASQQLVLDFFRDNGLQSNFLEDEDHARKFGSQLLVDDSKTMVLSRYLRHSHGKKGLGFTVDRHIWFRTGKGMRCIDSPLWNTDAEIIVMPLWTMDACGKRTVEGLFFEKEQLFEAMLPWEETKLRFRPEDYGYTNPSQAAIEMEAYVYKNSIIKNTANRGVVPLYYKDIRKYAAHTHDLSGYIE